MHRAERYARDQVRVAILDLAFRSVDRVNCIPHSHVLVATFDGDDGLWRQLPLHHHLPGLGPVDHPGLMRESTGIGTAVQDKRAEPGNGLRIADSEIPCKLVDSVIVLPGLADRFSRRRPVSLPPIGQLLTPPDLRRGVLPHSSVECRTRLHLFLGISGRAGSSAEPARRVGGELLPYRRGQWFAERSGGERRICLLPLERPERD